MKYGKFTFKNEAYLITMIHLSLPLLGLLLLLLYFLLNYLNS